MPNAVPAKSTPFFAARGAGASWRWSSRLRVRAATGQRIRARARQAMPARPVAQRRLTTEVETGFSAEAACAEATRCYLCCYLLDLDANQCIHCGACLDVRSAESCIVPAWGPGRRTAAGLRSPPWPSFSRSGPGWRSIKTSACVAASAPTCVPCSASASGKSFACQGRRFAVNLSLTTA